MLQETRNFKILLFFFSSLDYGLAYQLNGFFFLSYWFLTFFADLCADFFLIIQICKEFNDNYKIDTNFI